MITSSLGTFFWIMTIYLYFFKYKTQLSEYYDAAFIAVVIIFLYFINVEIMRTRCGVFSSVAAPSIVPWLFIFLPFVFMLYKNPSWKIPFSNTFGYLVVYLTDNVKSLDGIIKNKSQLELIYQSPALLINQFTYDKFEIESQKYKDVFIDSATNPGLFEAFKKTLLLKEIVSTWIWYMLIGSISVSTSYMMLMNGECTKSVDDYLMEYATG